MDAEPYGLLGLSLFYQGRRGEAYSAFLEYLSINPDAELAPFYVPPAAISFFAQVKKEAEPRLAPLRAQKRAEQDAQKKAEAEEAERRREREVEGEPKRLQKNLPSIERRVGQHRFLGTMVALGLRLAPNGEPEHRLL